MKYKSYALILFCLSLFSVCFVNISIAAVQLDEKFLKSKAGSGSVNIQVEELIEDIKNIRLNDGSHPKIIGWQRKGNIYTFSFTTPYKMVFRFEHLVNQGGDWSTISVLEDGKKIDALALIMQIASMPKDKTKFDIEREKKSAEQQQQMQQEQKAIEAANNKKRSERDAIIREARNEEKLKLLNRIDALEEYYSKDKRFLHSHGFSRYNEFDKELLRNRFGINNRDKFDDTLIKANSGDIRSMYEIGMTYKDFPYGYYESIDEMYFKWIFKAAANKHAAAIYESSLINSRSRKCSRLSSGVDIDTNLPKDEDLALEQLIESATLGYDIAQTELAKHYRRDDVKKYQEWLLKAVNQNELESIFLLGHDYIHGSNGFKENLKEGIRLLKLCINYNSNLSEERKLFYRDKDYRESAKRTLEKVLQ